MSNKKLDIVLNIEELTLGDVEDMSNPKVPFEEKMAILRRIIVKGDVRKIRVMDVPLINDMIDEALSAEANPTQEN